MRVLRSGSALAFQAKGGGSIPPTRLLNFYSIRILDNSVLFTVGVSRLL